MKKQHRGKPKGLRQSLAASTHDYPAEYHRKEQLYLKGEITHTGGGIYKVLAVAAYDEQAGAYIELPENLEATCTASKMDHRKISLLLGDYVTVEVPLLGMNPNEKLKGRIVWRQRGLSMIKKGRKS